MFIPIGLFLFVFAVYLRTHCATFNINDSGETIMVCKMLTISHSPGYPLHTLWGNVNCLFPLGKPMLRVTFASIITGSFSVVLTYWILKMMFKGIFVTDDPATPQGQNKPHPLLWEIPSLFGALTFAFSYQHWFQACGAKGGVYTLNMFISVSIIYLLFKMRERGWFIRAFLLICFIFGLGLAHHWHDQLAMSPGYFILFLAAQRRVSITKILRDLLRPFDLWEDGTNIYSALGFSNFCRAASFLILAISTYMFLPIRSVQNPIVNWWNPHNLERFWGTVVRKGYQNIGDPNFWPSFTRNIKRFWFHAQDQFGSHYTILFLLLAAWGLYWLFRRQKTAAMGFALMASGILMGVWVYCKPLEGYQWTLDNFFSTVFLIFAIFASAGIAGICEWVSREWRQKLVPFIAGGFSLGLGLIPFILNYPLNDQSRYISSYDEGINMLKTTTRGGVILCNGDIDILPLWYLQFVEGKRQDVVSFTMQLIPYDWYRNPLFERWPFLTVYVGQDIRQETVVQDMITQHAKDRPFYFTNIYTAPWMREKNPALPEGFLWRILNTKGLDYPFTAARLNQLWSTYRLRNMDAADRGYWDEYTDVMKDSYGIGYDFTGYFGFMNKMYDIALWGFNNAMNYRQPQTHERIYMMLGETYLNLGDASAAINNYQECLKRNQRNPYAYAKIGEAFLMQKDFINAESAFRASLTLNPQQKEAQDGLQQLQKAQQQQTIGEVGKKRK